MKTVIPMQERLRVDNDLFVQAEWIMRQWRATMNEGCICLTPIRRDNLFDILHLAQNKEPEPS